MSISVIILGFFLIALGIYTGKAPFSWVGMVFAGYHPVCTINIATFIVTFVMMVYLWLIDYIVKSNIDMIAVDLDSDKKGTFCDKVFESFSMPVTFRFRVLEGIMVIYFVSFIFVTILKFINKSIDFRAELDCVFEFMLVGKGANIFLSVIFLIILILNLVFGLF